MWLPTPASAASWSAVSYTHLPDALCCTFDLAAPTFRHKAYGGYKATRKGMPDELASQMPILKEVLAALNLSLIHI